MAGNASNLKSTWKLIGDQIELEPPELFHGSTYLGVVQRDVKNDDDQIKRKQEDMRNLLRHKTQVDQDAEHNYLNLEEFGFRKPHLYTTPAQAC